MTSKIVLEALRTGRPMDRSIWDDKKKCNELLHEILKPVLNVKFQTSDGYVAARFAEAVNGKQSSTRVFAEDCKNALEAIGAVVETQRLWRTFFGDERTKQT